MLRRWVLAGVAMMFFLAGCATDQKRVLINHTLRLVDDTTTRVRNVQEKVVAATDRMIAEKPADRELDLTEANEKCKELKDFCKKEVQGQAMRIQSERLHVSDTEKADLRKEYENQINTKMLALDKATKELDTAIKKMEEAVKTQVFENSSKQTAANKAIEEFKKELGAAQAEFESLNRKS